MDHLIRHYDILPPENCKIPITVIGAGAIGSFAVLALAKMGFEDITVYDFDTVDIENMNCQFYPHSAIGKKKVDALKELIKDFTNVDINAIDGKYEKGIFKGIVITAVDSMAARKLVFDNHKDIAMGVQYIIDPRMSAEFATLNTYCPTNEEQVKQYAKTLYSDEEATAERCTSKATMYTVGMISGLVAKTVKDIVTEGDVLKSADWCIKGDDFISYKHKKEGE